MAHPTLHWILLVLHIASAAYWFGLVAGVPRRVRAFTEADAACAPAVARALARDVAGARYGALAAYVLGLGLVFSAGGFAVLHPRYHAALGLGLLWVAVSWLLARALARLLQGETTAANRARMRGRAAALAGVGHLLWVTQLALMTYRG